MEDENDTNQAGTPSQPPAKISGSGTGAENASDFVVPILPSDFDEAEYREAVDLDEALGRYDVDDEVLKTKLATRRDRLFTHLSPRFARQAALEVGWPSWLYLPSGADWHPYLISRGRPPVENQYARSWVTPGSANSASSITGQSWAFKGARAEERYVQSEAGLGVVFTPRRTLSVVSLQPTVQCKGQYHQEVDFWPRPLGHSWLRISLILAAWQQIPGPTPWEFLGHNQFVVKENGFTSPVGKSPIWPFSRSFTGSELATPFLVEAHRTYLLGVVTRVSIWSTLTDDNGRPLSHDGNLFKVWGDIGCVVPQIDVFEEHVHIP